MIERSIASLMSHKSNALMTAILMLACGQSTVPADTDTSAPPSLCVQEPALTDQPATFLKDPYLLAPTKDGVTIAFETLEGGDGHIAIWKSPSDCMTVVQKAPAFQMDPTLKILGEVIEMPAPLGYQHATVISGLEPGQLYDYRVTIGNLRSETRQFRVAPRSDQDYRVGILGDTRTHDREHQRVVDGLIPHVPDLVVHTGDLMGAAGILEDWEGFFAIESELMAGAPFVPAFGNHEAALGHAYWAGYMHVPNPYSAKDKRDYAFAYGDSYWIVWDSATELEQPRLAWIEEQLIAAEAYPYRFVVAHHPFYSFSKHTPNEGTRRILHPLFIKHGVTAVWNGHNHCYEHFIIDGIHYVVTGGGGSKLYSTEANIVEDLRSKRVAARSTHHFAIAERTAEKMIVTVYDVDAEEVLETFTLLPNQTTAPPETSP